MSKKIRRRIGYGLLSIGIAVCYGIYLTRHQPIARFPLPDGTELRVEYVTYGTEHSVPRNSPLLAWLSDLAQRWPRLHVPRYAADYRYITDDPQLGVWLTHFDPRIGKFLPSLDEALRIQPVEDASGRQIIGSLSFPGGPNDLSSLSMRSTTYPLRNAPPMPHATLELTTYDRRKATVPLRATMQGQTIALEIPNPAAKIAFPRWLPEPLPQTRTLGEMEVVVRSLAVERNAPLGEWIVRPTVDFLRQEQKVPGVRILTTRFVDATGNRDWGGCAPMFSEAAWKMSMITMRTREYPFAESEGESFGPVKMPEAGQFALLESSPGDEKHPGPRVLALLGPGRYILQNGAFVETGQSLPEAEARAFLSAVAPGTIRIHVLRPTVLHLYDPHRRYARDVSGNWETIARLRWEGGNYGLQRVPESARFSTGQQNSPFFAVLYEPGQNEPPPSGTPVTVQLVQVTSETVEFLVAPPPLPEPRKKRE